MKRRPAAAIALAATLAGCASILPKAPPETYYDLKYDPAPVDCARSYAAPVEVWNFSAAGPYNRSEMVVTEGREVSFSRGHQWVDRPGVLVAQRLRRDLGAGRLFPLAVSPRDPEGASLQLTGDVYRFAWEKDGGSARARLQAEIVLRATGATSAVLMHERYDLESDPIAATDDASAFARAMSGVVSRFSAQVRRDLCTARAGAPHPSGRAGSPRSQPSVGRTPRPSPAVDAHEASTRPLGAPSARVLIGCAPGAVQCVKQYVLASPPPRECEFLMRRRYHAEGVGVRVHRGRARLRVRHHGRAGMVQRAVVRPASLRPSSAGLLLPGRPALSAVPAGSLRTGTVRASILLRTWRPRRPRRRPGPRSS